MRNKILIKIALFFLRGVNTKKIEFSSSFSHYVNKLGDFKHFGNKRRQ